MQQDDTFNIQTKTQKQAQSADKNEDETNSRNHRTMIGNDSESNVNPTTVDINDSEIGTARLHVYLTSTNSGPDSSLHCGHENLDAHGTHAPCMGYSSSAKGIGTCSTQAEENMGLKASTQDKNDHVNQEKISVNCNGSMTVTALGGDRDNADGSECDAGDAASRPFEKDANNAGFVGLEQGRGVYVQIYDAAFDAAIDARKDATDVATLSSACNQTLDAHSNALKITSSALKDMTDSDDLTSTIPTQPKRRRQKEGDDVGDVLPKKMRMQSEDSDMDMEVKPESCDSSLRNGNHDILGLEAQTQSQNAYIYIDS